MASGIINETSATNLGQGVATRPAPFQMFEMFARIFTHRVEAFFHEYKSDLASCKQQPPSNQCVSERNKRKNKKTIDSLLSSFTFLLLWNILGSCCNIVNCNFIYFFVLSTMNKEPGSGTIKKRD